MVEAAEEFYAALKKQELDSSRRNSNQSLSSYRGGNTSRSSRNSMPPLKSFASRGSVAVNPTTDKRSSLGSLSKASDPKDSRKSMFELRSKSVPKGI